MSALFSGPLEFIFDASSGTFSILEAGCDVPVLEGACSAVHLRNRKEWLRSNGACGRTCAVTPEAMKVSCVFGDTGISFDIYVASLPRYGGFSMEIILRNGLEEEIGNVDFYPMLLERERGGFLFGREGGKDFRFLRNGMLTWSHAGLMKPEYRMKKALFRFIRDACENSEAPAPEGKGSFVGEWFGAVRENIGRRMLVAGFSSTSNQLGQVMFKSAGGWFRRLAAVSHSEGSAVPPGGEMSSEELVIIAGGAESEKPMGFDRSLKMFAAASASACPPPALPENPVGWCSWYYYFQNMSEKVILENIEAAKGLRDRIPIEYIQVDDGYQPAPGDWLETTKKFPHGMAWLAERIREAGFRPGIWLSPFQATNRSRLFRENPDWFVKKKNGEPRFVTVWPSATAAGLIYALDTTHPEVLNWLKETFRVIVHEWGYEYLKLDFLYTGAIDGVRYDAKATRAQAFRRGLEAVREAAGDEAYILGCGIPLSLGLGLVNGARISGDTAPYWHSTLQSEVLRHPAAPGVPNAARSIFARYFMHRNFWLNDPDCLMARFNKTQLGGDEVLTHAACVALAGGPLVLSDNLSEYTPESIRLAQQLIPPVDTPAVPADLFESSLPATLVMPMNRDFDEVTLVGRFNWGSQAHDLDVHFDDIGLDPGKKYHVYDLWEDHYYGIHSGEVTLPRVPPHASRMLSIRPVRETPHTIATTFHFTQGGMDMKAQEYDFERKKLIVKLSAPGRRSGRVYFHFPEGFNPEHALINGPNETMPVREHGRFFSLELDMDENSIIEIDFLK